MPLVCPACIPTPQHFGHPASPEVQWRLRAHLRAVGSGVLQILTGSAVPKLLFTRGYTASDSGEQLSPLPRVTGRTAH